MNNIRVFIAIAGLLVLAMCVPILAAVEEGVAVAIVYDNSGSMRGTVRTTSGKLEAKYLIANRALLEVIQRLETCAGGSAGNPARKIHAGLFVFEGNGAREVTGFGPLDASAMRGWIKKYPGPGAGTPLGTAIDTASKVVLNSPLSQKHVLVITDGVNTVGPDPVGVVPRIQKSSEAKGAMVFIHFVAFDIDARHFAPLKKLGVTVVGASDEKQLNQQLTFILEEKILLERETK
jgi:hypothetical protein